MKYLIITACHHDGFAMYPSRISDYKLMEWSQYQGPDPLMALRKACRDAGLLFGIYYSPLEFRGSPNGFNKDDEEVVEQGFSYKTLGPQPYASDDEIAALAKRQIHEIVVNYQPDIISDIKCEKVAVFNKSVDVVHVDMVGIDMVGTGPTQRLNGLVGFRSYITGGCSDDGMFPV